jgi:hypothetical protein
MTQFTAGTPAFIDSFGGMVPCTVIEVHTPCNGRRIGPRNELTVRVDKTMAGYRKGEVLQRNAAYTPPKVCRIKGQFFYRIQTTYEYVPSNS